MSEPPHIYSRLIEALNVKFRLGSFARSCLVAFAMGACLSVGLFYFGAARLVQLSLPRIAGPVAASNLVFLPTEEITTRSPMLDAVIQNTPGYSEGYAVGVPRSYDWCSGSYKPPENSVPPADFTAVTGWGQIYPKAGARLNASPDTTIAIANAKTYVRLKSTRAWVLLQDQSQTGLAGSYFVADFSPRPGVRMPLTPQADGSVAIGPPPVGRNAHFWITTRGVYPAGTVDGVYVQMDIRTSQPKTKTNLIANVGADWWRDATAKFVQGFANNPGAGMSNWVELSSEWSTLRFYSPSTSELLTNPPPPLVSPARDAGPIVTRRRATTPAPCLTKPHEPLPKALVQLERL